MFNLKPANRRRLTITLYILGAFLFWVSLFICVPTLSTYVQDKVPGLAVVGTILSMCGLAQGLVRKPPGMAADGLCRRKPTRRFCGPEGLKRSGMVLLQLRGDGLKIVRGVDFIPEGAPGFLLHEAVQVPNLGRLYA